MITKDTLESIGVKHGPLYPEDVLEELHRQEAKLRVIALTVEVEADRAELDAVIGTVRDASEKLATFIYG